MTGATGVSEREADLESSDTETPDSRKSGSDDSSTGETPAGVADSGESGYRRDDYLREESNENLTAEDVIEPENGFAFQTPEERARASEKTPNGPASDDTGSSGKD